MRSCGFYGNNTAGGTQKYHWVVHSSPSIQISKTNCGKCGYEHRDDVCPAQGQRCRQCSGRNHFGRMCKQRASTLNLVEEEQSNNDFYLDAATVLDVQEERNAWTVDLDFYGKLVKSKVDTGADVTVLKEADFRKLPRRPQLSSSQIPYLNSPGGKVDTVGEFIAKVTRRGQGQGPVTYRFHVVVVPSSAGANLLARSVSEAMGLVKRLEEVDVHDNIFGSTGLLRRSQ